MMKFTKHGARELFLFSGPPAAILVIALICGNFILALCMAPLVWFVANFFRDPERTCPNVEGGVVSPADGQVTAVEEADMPWIGPCHRVSVFMNVFSVHVNRMPVSGVVEHIEHIPGKFLNAMAGEAATANERVLVGLKGDDGRRYLVVQIAGLIARNIVTPVEIGDRFERGQRYGMIKFGSRTDVYIEKEAPWTPHVTVGQWVKSGEQLLGVVGP